MTKGNIMKTIIVSAGHSPLLDSGAVTKDGKRECDLVIPLRDALARKLRDSGVRVVSVSDAYSLSQTIKFSKSIPHDIAVEIHMNYCDNESAEGVEVLYRKGEARMSQLATVLSLELSKAFDLKNRGAKDDTKSARGRLGFLRELENSVLIEACFLSNPTDLSKVVGHEEAWGAKVAEVLIRWCDKIKA